MNALLTGPHGVTRAPNTNGTTRSPGVSTRLTGANPGVGDLPSKRHKNKTDPLLQSELLFVWEWREQGEPRRLWNAVFTLRTLALVSCVGGLLIHFLCQLPNTPTAWGGERQSWRRNPFWLRRKMCRKSCSGAHMHRPHCVQTHNTLRRVGEQSKKQKDKIMSTAHEINCQNCVNSFKT